jgi:hypothetical protein
VIVKQELASTVSVVDYIFLLIMDVVHDQKKPKKSTVAHTPVVLLCTGHPFLCKTVFKIISWQWLI